ncbi:MAG TPA: type II toxin-antitoxin system HicA family toxin [Candidatus Nanoarchaeia archaeon]|nr:type II toxin-antitoxin system HicA family toxin [Candidatus Nanoarchaeia archaeon]
MRAPTLSGKEIIALLEKQGFVVKRQKGSHMTLYKKTSEKGLYVTVPLHGNKEIKRGTLLSIIRQAGMTKEEFGVLLKYRR